jgi:ferric-dicitrate binding protein FerR (iron transport regulator)
MQTHARFAYLFRRYLDKTISSEELKEMRTYIGNPDYDEDLRLLIGEGWDRNWPPEEQDPERAESIFRAIVAQDRSLPRPHRLWYWAAAALISGAMATGIYLLWQRPAAEKKGLQATAPIVPKEPLHEYLSLPDGSKVLLNAGSTLEYANSFNASERGVYLSGEAFFSIRKETGRPFVVYTGKVKTVVLGTTFNIRAYSTDKDVTVTVTSGKVKVDHGLKTIGIITPNEQVTVSHIGDAVKKLQVDADQAMAWRQQDILFEDQPMPEVVKILEQRFDVHVILENPALAACHVTAAFVRQERLEDIIRIIARINNLEYRISGNSVLLSGQGCR